MTVYTSTLIASANDVTLSGHAFQDIYDTPSPGVTWESTGRSSTRSM